MPIPDFQSIMLPLLESVKDGNKYYFKVKVDELAKYYKLTDEELKQMLPSERAYTFYNRVAWAKTYLKQAGLVVSPKRGLLKITEKGKEILKANPDKIDIKYLKQFTEYTGFKSDKKTVTPKETVITNNNNSNQKTPLEEIEYGYNEIKENLILELVSKLKGISPSDFEKLVVDLLVKMGYGGSIEDAGEVIGKSGDEGIDGIIKEDKLGLDNIYIQAKRWENVVSRPEIQKFVGALAGKQAKKGVFITTSHFSKSAYEYIKIVENKLILLNGHQLAELMIDYNVGITVSHIYEIKKIDLDYFEDM